MFWCFFFFIYFIYSFYLFFIFFFGFFIFLIFLIGYLYICPSLFSFSFFLRFLRTARGKPSWCVLLHTSKFIFFTCKSHYIYSFFSNIHDTRSYLPLHKNISSCFQFSFLVGNILYDLLISHIMLCERSRAFCVYLVLCVFFASEWNFNSERVW